MSIEERLNLIGQTKELDSMINETYALICSSLSAGQSVKQTVVGGAYE